MGIEEIQKVNALARELMRHGIAGTSDEALLKAKDMLRANPVDSMTAAISANTSIGRTEQHAGQQALSEINMDIRSLGVRFDAIARELLSMKDEMRKLGSSMSDVSGQVMRLAARQEQPVSTPVHKAEAAPVSEQVQQATLQQPQFEKPRQMMARAGKEEYRPEDVAIEKIFYFGK
ncbi:TPA: hypothetical protein HA231_00275 [Candidatus Woesearchaeota archaeon]|nr:hypothetical protein [Candidatus Woesearchaeota archaeon]